MTNIHQYLLKESANKGLIVIKRINQIIRVLLFWLLIILAISLSILRVFLLDIDDYKTDLESRIFELTTIPIEIGTMRANMRGISPEIILSDIKVISSDPSIKSAIKLDEMRVGINLPLLLFTRQVLTSSWLSLVGVKLSIIRQKDGQISIVGLNTEDSEQPYWLLKAGKYELLKSEITWIDEQTNANPIKFDQVNLVIKNDPDEDKHELHIISHSPNHYGNMLRVSVSTQGDIFNTQNFNGRLYISGRGMHLKQLLLDKLPSGFDIVEGEADFKLWSLWEKSKLINLAGKIKAKQIIFRKSLDQEQKKLEIKSFYTNLVASVTPSGKGLMMSDFALETETNKWETQRFSLFSTPDYQHFSGLVNTVELQELTKLVTFFVPLNAEKKQLIANIKLTGQLKNFLFYTNNRDDQYAVNGAFENISTQAFSNYPQLTNFNGLIIGSKQQGLLHFNTQNSQLLFPEVFRQTLPITSLNSTFKWQKMPNEWRITTENLALNIQDVWIKSRMALTIPKNFKDSIIDLQTSFGNIQNISFLSTYCPAGIIDKETVSWLDTALVAGEIEQGRALVSGKLNDFPFKNGGGVFKSEYKVENIKLQYATDWPPLQNLSTQLSFLNDQLTVNIQHANSNGLVVDNAVVEIPSFENSQHVLIKGQLKTSADKFLSFFQKTPLQSEVNSLLDAIAFKGLTQIDLNLKVPIVDNATVEIDGLAEFKDIDLNIKDINLNINNLRGQLKFTENGLFSDGLEASALGNPIFIKVNSQNQDTFINLKGKTDALHLSKQFDFFDNALTNNHKLVGSFAYKILLHVSPENQSVTMNINSDLKGLAIDWPGLLKKTVNQKKNLALNLVFNQSKLFPISLNYNNELKVALHINKQKKQIKAAHIVYANNIELDPFSTLENGFKIQIEQNSFDLSDWTSFLKTNINDNNQSESLLNQFSLKTDQLVWDKKNHGSLNLSLQQIDNAWQGSLNSSFAKGKFSIPLKTTNQNKIKLNMAFLNLDKLMQIKSQSDQFETKDFPLINLSSKQFIWNDIDQGKLQIETERSAEGISFKQIKLISDEYEVSLSGHWDNTTNRTDFSGYLQTMDFGKFLSKIDISNDFKETQARIDYTGNWLGSPFQFSLINLHATLDLELLNGRISSIEPGFGRILGLIAFEQWVKRLSLDFSDLYMQGLSFNKILGNITIDSGSAITNNLVVDAIPAEITIQGEADLIAKTLNHRARVIPKSSGAIPIAGTIVSNIAKIITKTFTENYSKGYFFSSKYKITGNWDAIEVTPIPEQDGIIKKTWTGLTDFSWMKTEVE